MANARKLEGLAFYAVSSRIPAVGSSILLQRTRATPTDRWTERQTELSSNTALFTQSRGKIGNLNYAQKYLQYRLRIILTYLLMRNVLVAIK